MTFKPIGSQVLVEYEDNKPAGDILLPDSTVTMDFSMFVVRAVGQGFLTLNGWLPLPLKPGDRVKLTGSAKGNLRALEPHLVNDRKLAVVDIAHVVGVWEGELPSPRIARKIAVAHAEGMHA